MENQPRDEVIEQVRGELSALWPAAGEAKLLQARVVTEQHAVFSPLPGSEQFRPRQQTSVPNLFLAGDWTATGWPATMEGAVRSGYLAAEALLTHLRKPAKLLDRRFAAPRSRPLARPLAQLLDHPFQKLRQPDRTSQRRLAQPPQDLSPPTAAATAIPPPPQSAAQWFSS